MASRCVLIDTDPGVDDALAILMAHAHAEVVGLAVVGGNVGLAHTTRNALKLIETIGAETPVFPGSATPLVFAAPDAGFVHGADGFGDTGYLSASRLPEEEHAAAAIVRLARERPGELTLVALAPLTNLALALRLDPSLPERIVRLVVMGGAVNGRGNTERVPAEFNIGFDPEAAHVVFSTWPRFDLVDWEACLRHTFDFARFDAWLENGDARAHFYAAISRKARAFNRARGRPGVVSADALAMAVALDADIVTRAESHHVSIEMSGTSTRGATVVDWENRLGRPANARIILEVDRGRFENLAARSLGVAAHPDPSRGP
ncbi:MAG TPA: nucleoside hydrolase [Rhodanobacteraceae bacterium]|nr:nucleoside hydrolase [Rhodanobacteraceae bacterium]